MHRYFEFVVTLKHIEPPVWRSFLLEANATFYHLHEAIKVAFDWGPQRTLWEFTTPGTPGSERKSLAGKVNGTVPWESPTDDGETMPLKSFFMRRARGQSCVYMHDFASGWEHIVEMKRSVKHKDEFHRRILDGERNRPPEGCTSVLDYDRMAEVARTGTDPWGDDPLKWRRKMGDWHPDNVDIEGMRRGFDVSLSQVDGPIVVEADEYVADLPDDIDPLHQATADLLARNMLIRDMPGERIKAAQDLWAEYVVGAQPKPRKPSIYAASIEYCVSLEFDTDASQDYLATIYGTSAGSISRAYQQIQDYLGLGEEEEEELELGAESEPDEADEADDTDEGSEVIETPVPASTSAVALGAPASPQAD